MLLPLYFRMARGASLVEVVVVVGLVALAAIGGFSAFGGSVRGATLDFGTKVANLQGNTPGASPTNTSAGSFAAPDSNHEGPTCDPVHGCGGGSTESAPAAAPSVAPADQARIDSIVRALFQKPVGEQRDAILKGLSTADVQAVDARITQLDAAFITLQNGNDPAYKAFAASDARLESEQGGVFSFLNGGGIAAAQADRARALDSLLTRSFQTLAAGKGAPPGTPGGGAAIYGQLGDLLLRTSVAPDFKYSNGSPIAAGLTATDRARTWDIQRSRDAEANAEKAFADYLTKQPRATRLAAAQDERAALAAVRATIPEKAQAEFDRYFTARTVVVDGKPEVRIVPSEELKHLEDAQASLIGVKVDGYTSSRTSPFNAPSNGQEALQWWLTFGSLQPQTLAAQWNPPPSDAIATADEVFALIPIGTAVTVVRSVGAFTIREIASMASKEVLTNIVIGGTTEAISAKYGPLAGSAVPITAVLAALVTHRLSAPSVVAAAEKFGGCFVAGTLVATAAGMMPIETIEVGTMVLSRDADTQAISYQPVVQTFVKHDKPIVRLVVEDLTGAARTERIGVTEEHPFWVEGQGWTKVADLAPGMRLSTAKGAALVRSMSLEKKTQDVYNFEVEGTHTYFVGRFETWVHNICDALVNALVKPGVGKQAFTVSREALKDVEGRIVGDVTGSVAVKADAANEVASAIVLAKDPNIAKVYLGDEAVRYLRQQAIAAGKPLAKDARLPDVVAVTKDGRLVLAEAKGKNVEKAGSQFQSVSDALGANRIAGQNVYSSKAIVGGDVGAGFQVVDGRVMQILVEGESRTGAVPIFIAARGEWGYAKPWLVNGVPVYHFPPDWIVKVIRGS